MPLNLLEAGGRGCEVLTFCVEHGRRQVELRDERRVPSCLFVFVERKAPLWRAGQRTQERCFKIPGWQPGERAFLHARKVLYSTK